MPGTSFESDNDDFDSQDQSETLDDANVIGDGDAGEVRTYAEADEIRTLDDLPGVRDMTEARGDRDEDEAVALDAGEFDPSEVGDADLQEDNELDDRAADAAREDDIDGLGPEDSFDEDRISASEVEGLETVRDADQVEGGEDDVSDYQRSDVSDRDLAAMGYADKPGGES